MFNRLSYKEEVHLLVLIHMLDFEKQTEFLLSVLFCFIDYLAYISLNCEKREMIMRELEGSFFISSGAFTPERKWLFLDSSL
jgi:uncharacterized membrane protein